MPGVFAPLRGHIWWVHLWRLQASLRDAEFVRGRVIPWTEVTRLLPVIATRLTFCGVEGVPYTVRNLLSCKCLHKPDLTPGEFA
jgi:hypothetical protein